MTTSSIVIPVAKPKPGLPPAPDSGVYYPDAYEVCLRESMFHFRPRAFLMRADIRLCLLPPADRR